MTEFETTTIRQPADPSWELSPTPVAGTAPRRRSPLAILAWFLFFAGLVLLNTAPFWVHLFGGPALEIQPGILDDPSSVAVSIVSAWVMFVIAAALARAGGMTRGELGLASLPFGRFFAWTAIVFGGLIAVWALVSVVGGDDLHVIEPITRAPQGWAHWLLWIALAASAGFTEEFTMRGYGIGFWTSRGAPRWPVAIVMSALFGALHLYEGRHAAAVIAVWGILFAWSYVRTGSLWPGIVAHTLVDAVAPLEFLLA